MGARERARDYAYRFGDANGELRETALRVAAYLYLPRDAILEVWADIDSIIGTQRPAAA